MLAMPPPVSVWLRCFVHGWLRAGFVSLLDLLFACFVNFVFRTMSKRLLLSCSPSIEPDLLPLVFDCLPGPRDIVAAALCCRSWLDAAIARCTEYKLEQRLVYCHAIKSSRRRFNKPSFVVATPGGLLIADTFNHSLRHTTWAGEPLDAIGGSTPLFAIANGFLTSPHLHYPTGVAYRLNTTATPSKTAEVFVANNGQHEIRRTTWREGGKKVVDFVEEEAEEGVEGPAVRSTTVTQRDEMQLSTSGAFRGRGCRLNQVRDPQGLALLGDILFIADYSNHRVLAVDAISLETKLAIGARERGRGYAEGALRQPFGLAALEETGELYVVDSGHKRICVFRADTGEFLRAIGGATMEAAPLSATAGAAAAAAPLAHGTGDVQHQEQRPAHSMFDAPVDVAVGMGRLFVSDQPRRIHVLGLDGSPQHVFVVDDAFRLWGLTIRPRGGPHDVRGARIAVADLGGRVHVLEMMPEAAQRVRGGEVCGVFPLHRSEAAAADAADVVDPVEEEEEEEEEEQEQEALEEEEDDDDDDEEGGADLL
jgi:hypothetical protein